ncbi:hypothetical protein C8E01_1041 [Pontibacter virosus]|uniref:Uncharacterized protein n=1 Tax=Pontibacter virosus TaxID=1765052 RepID=A0A2U1AZ66_9BACT|nr:hypothetical protein C8E01_1041 [Pontibacter virosus]
MQPLHKAGINKHSRDECKNPELFFKVFPVRFRHLGGTAGEAGPKLTQGACGSGKFVDLCTPDTVTRIGETK